MKKNILLLVILATLSIPNFGMSQSNNSEPKPPPEEFISLQKDTVYQVEHPNSQDSALVIAVVNGVTNVTAILLPKQYALINQLKPIVAPFLIALILGIMRRRSIRKMKRKGLIPKDYKVPLG